DTASDIWNNIFINVDCDGSSLQQPQGFGDNLNGSQKNRFYHNIAYDGDGGTDGFVGYGFGLGSRYYASAGTDVSNNIAVLNEQYTSERYQYYIHEDSTGSVCSYNLGWHTTGTDKVFHVSKDSGSDLRYTASEANDNDPAGVTVEGNEQASPNWVGGTLPTSMVNGVPNTNYFALTQATLGAVKATGNSLSGEAGWGYDESAAKFNLDITGKPRLGWSMGPYEWGGSITASGTITIEP
ncbi:MAG: hypothetical protein OEU26_26585, partial [Candidatus Tectomicrobia bacterium]|nr:hypothetical protein [Candidatus Tectomicrobia bacterium]